jgi:hypothetical protein
MALLSQSFNPESPSTSSGELYLLFGDALFGISFLDLAEAKAMADLLCATGREVDVFEKNSGRVVYHCASRA